jgi:hypothetical protein
MKILLVMVKVTKNNKTELLFFFPLRGHMMYFGETCAELLRPQYVVISCVSQAGAQFLQVGAIKTAFIGDQAALGS